MKTEYAPFDASSHLDNEEVIAEYLSAAAEDENPDVLLLALADVAKARGMAHVAKAAGLSRESLYKMLAPGSHPRFETIRAILRALNVEIAVRASAPGMMAAKRGMREKGDRLKAEPMASPKLAEEIIERMKAPRTDEAKPESPAKSAKETARAAQRARRELRRAAKPAGRI